MNLMFRRIGVAGVVLAMVFFGGAQAASAVTVEYVSPAEGCPGEIVTFHGSGFKTGAGQRPKAEWLDEGIKEQYGPSGEEKKATQVLETTSPTEVRAVVPQFGQVWEGPKGPHLNGRGTVKFEGKTLSFTYNNLYGCFNSGENAGLTAEEREKLKLMLPHMKYVSAGVGGKPTIQFSGVNVQVVNGEGECVGFPLGPCGTRTANGAGNLVIGYDEHPGEQTGSHNLILGEYQTFTSYGGIDAGVFNKLMGSFDSITGGGTNMTTSNYDAVSGGADNVASGYSSWVGGGEGNVASGYYASVSGGKKNIANGQNASVTGGKENVASGTQQSFEDGKEAAWIGGGYKNHSAGKFSAIFGGDELTATGEYEAIP